MKLKRIIIIVIFSILTIGITLFTGFYYYGLIGRYDKVQGKKVYWDKGQIAFVDDYYNNLKTSKEIVETFVKFNSCSYRNHTVDVRLYEDYTTSSNLLPATEEIKLDNFTFSIFTLLGDSQFKKYSYEMFFYNIDNSSINMNNLAIVLFENIENNNEILKQNINDYKQQFLNGELLDFYTDGNLDYLSKNNFFTNGDLLFDLDGKARIYNGNALNRLLYEYSLMTYTFAENNSKLITNMTNCDFMLVELAYDNDKNPKDMDILCVGNISNIVQTQNEYTENNELKEAFGIDTLQGIKNAGYNKYIMPKVILYSSIAFVICAFLSVMAFITFNNYWKKKETNNINKEKPNKNSRN